MDRLKILLAHCTGNGTQSMKASIDQQPDMAVISEVSSGVEAVQQVVHHQPDVLVVALTDSHAEVIQVTRMAIQAQPDLRVVGIFPPEDADRQHELLEAGASSCILVQPDSDQWIEDLRLAAGTAFAGPAREPDPALAYEGTEAENSARSPIHLSLREAEVLRLASYGYTNKEIASQLNLSPKTIETYKARAMSKTGLHNRVDIVRFAFNQGWLADLAG